MSIESLSSQIEYALGDSSFERPVFIALLRDFVRALHETFVKSARDQNGLLAQVQTIFGSTPAHHLAKVICADIPSFRSYRTCEECRLFGQLTTLCAERGISYDDGRALAAHFLKALDEERYGSDGSIESATFLVYWTLGDEAAYHLGGLYLGDNGGIVRTSLQYLDHRLKRFRTQVECWEMELAWEMEDRE